MLSDKKNLINLIRIINKYDKNISKIILKYLNDMIIHKYFSKYRIEIWYCDIHDQGFLIPFLNIDRKISDIYTQTCCNYCHLRFLGNLNIDFIKNFKNNYIYLDYKLIWFLGDFYDYSKDQFNNQTPLAIKLFFEKEMIRNN